MSHDFSAADAHLIFELASVGIFRSTPDGQIVLANPALAAMLGYAGPDELRSLDLARDVYLHGDERRALVARYEHSDRPWTVEVQWKKKDGTPLWVQISAHVIADGAGATRYFEAFVLDVTERRASEEALRESEARYRALVENLPDASAFLFDHDLRYLLADGTNFKASGLSKEMLEDRTIWEVLPADLCSRLAPRYRAALGGETVRFEETYNARWYDVHLFPIRGAGGEIIYGMGVSHDVTERHRAAALLAENESRLRAIIDTEPECVKLLDAEGRLITMNPAGLAMIEADALEQVAGESVLAIAAPEDRAAFADLTRRVFKGESGTLEFDIVGLRGTRRRLDTHAVPLRDAEGRITALLGITRDITSRKAAEHALRESEERLRLVSRATNDVVWDWDLLSDALWWGEGVQHLFGYAPEEIEPGSESWHTRLHPDDRERVIAGIRTAIDGGATFWSDEYRFQRRDGSYADIYDRGYVIHAQNGRAVRMVGSMMDVTDRKRAESQLRSLAMRLDAVREEERTRIAREIHDQLGQALTALKMDLAWLGQKLPARGTTLRAKLHGMEGVIDQTMDAMHRIVAELRPGVLDDLGLPAAIRWLAADFQQRTHIRCAVSVTGAEPALDTGQATAVFRILQEALTNVARHARAKRVDIRFHVVPIALELVVADDGRGITADEAQNRRTLGILGIRERALSWRGEVTIHGEPGHGTTMRVFMPITPPTPPAQAAPAGTAA
jgi:PAS domain S-box-containing protein